MQTLPLAVTEESGPSDSSSRQLSGQLVTDPEAASCKLLPRGCVARGCLTPRPDPAEHKWSGPGHRAPTSLEVPSIPWRGPASQRLGAEEGVDTGPGPQFGSASCPHPRFFQPLTSGSRALDNRLLPLRLQPSPPQWFPHRPGEHRGPARRAPGPQQPSPLLPLRLRVEHHVAFGTQQVLPEARKPHSLPSAPPADGSKLPAPASPKRAWRLHPARLHFSPTASIPGVVCPLPAVCARSWRSAPAPGGLPPLPAVCPRSQPPALNKHQPK